MVELLLITRNLLYAKEFEFVLSYGKPRFVKGGGSRFTLSSNTIKSKGRVISIHIVSNKYAPKAFDNGLPSDHRTGRTSTRASP